MLVGIDFGTTYSCIHYIKNGTIKPFLIDNMNLIPSVIDINNNAGLDINSNNVIMNLKSTLDNFGDSYITIFFNYLYQKLKELDNNIEAVISVPANFDHHKRTLIKTTFENVGIKVLKILNEPTASVLGYNTDREKVLIIDIGAGTTDITYLEYIEGVYQIIKNEGNNDLGGNKITDNLLIYFKMESNKENFDKMEFIKKKINYLGEENLFLNGKIIDQEIFEEINQDFINNFNEILNKFDDIKIEEILLVGGCCNSYLISKLITNKFSDKPIKKSKNMQEIVSIGCCRYAGILMNELKDEIVLVDVVPLSLGVKLVDGTFSVIIDKNSILPITKTNTYITNEKDSDDIEIEIYQGENPIAEKNSLISKVIFKNDKYSNPLFKLSLKIDTNGLISLYVLEENSQKMEKYKLENIKYHKAELKYSEIDLVKDYEVSNLMKEKYQLKNILNNYLNHLENVVNNSEIMKDISDIYDNLDQLTLEEILKLKEKYIYIPQDIIDSDFYNVKITETELQQLKDGLDNINKILINYQNINDEEEQYLKTNLEILQISNIDELTLRKQINSFEKIKRVNYIEELNYLITYLLENLNELGLNQENKEILLNYINSINLENINSNSLAEITLNNLNKFCENLI